MSITLARIAIALAVLLLAHSLASGAPDIAEPTQPYWGDVPAKVVKDGLARINCDWQSNWKWHADFEHHPKGAGPLRLTAVYCQKVEGMNYRRPHGDVSISPDGRSVVYASDEIGSNQRAIHTAPLGAWDKWTDYAADLAYSSRILNLPQGGRASFQWSADSRFVWAATQDRSPSPSRWAIGPVKPFRAEGGRLKLLPALHHKAGPLDGIEWIGDGKALALFGARGYLQKPKREDPNPTLAIVDAAHGKVLDSHPVAVFAKHLNAIAVAEGAVLSDGRVRVFLRANGKAFLWTQGKPVTELPSELSNVANVALSNDGKHLLAVRYLPRETGCDIFHITPQCGAEPPPATLASLHELPSGRELWTLLASDDGFGAQYYPVPAISPDNKYALLGLPLSNHQSKSPPRYALVSMRDGRILQTMQSVTERYALGFANNGKIAWMHNEGFTALFRVE